MSERPDCRCHGEPMRRAKHSNGGWRCAVKQRAHDARTNPRRIHVGRTYIGTESLYPAPREAVAQFARELIEQHKKEAHVTYG
jgi:hypothetical protein